MFIQTESRRLAFAATVNRLFPIIISGRLGRLYPRDLARKENVSFLARSSLGNILFRFPCADVHATVFAVRGFFEWRNVVIVNALCSKGDTILDIGSNIGTETLLFAKIAGLSGQVVAFEPLPNNHKTLQDLISLNGLTNIKLYKAAVSNVQGKLEFVPPKDNFYSGLGRLSTSCPEAHDADNVIEVEAMVLDDLFETGKFSKPRMIVMDVEGAEMFVMKGAEKVISECKPYMILEVVPVHLLRHGLVPTDIFDFMQANDYTCWVIDRWGLRKALRDCKKIINAK